MSSVAAKLLTFEEFERLPDEPGKRELLEGDLIDLPVAELRHKRIAHRIYGLLNDAVNAAHDRGGAAELGEVFHEMGYKLSENSFVQPDVSVTHRTQAEGKYFAGAPAIAIEVVSPSNMAEEMETKVALYFQHGAREVWRVFPKTRHVVVHVGAVAHTVLEQDSIRTSLLPGFELPVRDILS